VYSSKRDHDKAIADYTQAIRLNPKYAVYFKNRGGSNYRKGDLDKAIADYTQAIRLKHDDYMTHYNLGSALDAQSRHQEAETAYRHAIRLKPDFPQAHCNLGHVLRKQGRFDDALQSLRRGHVLGTARLGWPYPSAVWVRQCQRLLELDRLLPAVLNGNVEPSSPQERLELASLCQMPCKRLHATAARLATDAFRADPNQAEDRQQQHRYHAARSAVLAAAGQADDARVLPDMVVLKLRKQGYRWLRDDLALYASLAGQSDSKLKEPVRQRLAHWRQDTDLASVRDKPALARLDADERQQWQLLWQDVEALLVKVAPKK
jgi:hypothetical protein